MGVNHSGQLMTGELLGAVKALCRPFRGPFEPLA